MEKEEGSGPLKLRPQHGGVREKVRGFPGPRPKDLDGNQEPGGGLTPVRSTPSGAAS